ncbi:glycosyltransferase family protein [Thalassospira sp.]|uniref:glycosyltransferase family protein n=1 Tax=Thalassospira sp. TaxID=1912094 RepID=UPI002734A29D|nr:glycosyltransferase [Thalassospira sp.]MDP2698106.1 glycosyltransferase [Thalassospira sp.]
MTDVMIYVQHLLGIGHVRRTALLVAALRAQGVSVAVVSGGIPDPLIDFGTGHVIQLPPCRTADHGFSGLVDQHGVPVDAHWQDRRRVALLDAYASLFPKVLMIEMFPFGRRAFRFELLPLLERAGQDGVDRVCSVRDLLVRKDDIAKERWMRDIARQYFDTILVHGDPALFDFGHSFPFAGDLADLITYTGYVAPDKADVAGFGGERDGVVVSAGGGAVGRDLIMAAMSARTVSRRFAGYHWDIITGPHFPAHEFDILSQQVGEANLSLHRFVPDFRDRLARAALSVSQAGYNTLMDVLVTGVPAVMVPFDSGGESEQGERAGIFARKKIISVLAARELSGEKLANAMDQVNLPGQIDLLLDGARVSAAKIATRLRGR